MLWFKKKKKVPVSSLSIPQDIHTHLIPGVDDGRFTVTSAAATLVEMYKKGTRRVFLTPHMISGLYESSVEELNRRMQGIIESIDKPEAIPELALAAEYMVDETFKRRVVEGEELLTLPGNRILIEMSYYAISPQIFEVVSRLSQRGCKPVLAHPERYIYMYEDMDDFDRLYDMGCVFQLNLASATGIYGEISLRIIDRLFERSYYAFVGSDVHSPEQFESIHGSYMSQKIAEAGAQALLWEMLSE